MTDHELPPALAALRPPAPSQPAAARALFRATIALGHAAATRHNASSSDEQQPARATSSPFRFLLFSPSLALPALAALLLLPLLLPAPAARSVTASSADSAFELLAQLEQLFPGQLDAVIDREGVLQLELSAVASSATPPADQALLLELTRGQRRLRIVAYSGRSLRVRLDHHELRFSALLTGAGQVLLAGDDFAWTPSSATPRALAGWQITARPLAAVL